MTAPSRDGTEGANRSGASPNLMPEGLPSEDASRRQPTDGQDAGRPELGKGETKDAELLECGCHTMEGRALVVCLDGTSNQFGENNTNVIELYDRIIKDKKQLTYYNSGIGTYAKPSWRSFGYWRQVVSNKIDTAIAWNFEKILLGAYRWLSANYEEADRIYLFGFSRGAYQVRALAGMIEKVGLILPGNEEQIPFAYQLYADHKSDKYKNRADTTKTFNMAKRFKDTFSRKSRSGVRVHYLGVWDTVSSIGVARSKSLPLTDTCDHFCYMRHALALDERRVKFQPEYARGGESWVLNSAQQANPNTLMEPSQGDAGLEGKNEARVQDKPKSRPRVKEVWFAGSHSDIGGGVKSNTELNNAAIPAMWMGNEAAAAGLSLSRSRAVWDVKELRKDRPKNSLSIGWRVLEVYPFKQLSYKDLDSTHRRWHLASARIIKPGQKIHASVALAGTGYYPKAKFQKGGPENWDKIIGQGEVESLEWAHALGDLLELDLFDHSDISNIIDNLNHGEPHARVGRLDKLAFMARSYEGARAIETSDPKFGILFNLLNDRNGDVGVRIATCGVLEALAHQGRPFTDDQFSILLNLLDDENGDARMKTATCGILKEQERQGRSFTDGQVRTLFNLLGGRNSDASVKIATCSILNVLVHQGHSFTNDQLSTFFNCLDDENGDASMKIAICSILEVLARQGCHFTNDQFSALSNLLDGEKNGNVKTAASRVLEMLAYGGNFTDDQFGILLNLLDDKNGDVSMKITTCSILEMLAHHGHIFGDYITAPTIYRLIANSNKELQMAGLQALGAFQHRSIPPSVLATIRQLVLPMLKDGFRNGFIATLALCSCIHEPDFFHGIIRHMGVSDLVDIFVEFLDGHSTGGKISGVRGLMGVMEHGESPQQAISQNSRAAAALVELLGHDKPVVSQAGLHGVLAFGQNDILRPLMRETDVIYSLSRLAVGSDTPDVQRNVLLAFKALVRDDEIAKKAVIHDNYYLGYPPLPRKIKHQLESDPRFKSKVDEDTVQSSTGASTI